MAKQQAKAQQQGETLAFLGSKLLNLAQESEKYASEIAPRLRELQQAEALERQRHYDIGDIYEALGSGDFATMQKLADDFRNRVCGREEEIPF